MPENDPSEGLIEAVSHELKPAIDLGEIMIEDDTELEATELELQWYRAVARSMEYYGRQYLFAWSSLGLSMAFMFLSPGIDSGSLISFPKEAIIVGGILLPLLLIGCGCGAWRSSLFPKESAKFAIAGMYDVTITRSGSRQWFGYYTLLMPKSLESIIHRGQRYVGEGFIISKGSESWCIPTKLGEWMLSENDTPQRTNRVLGWFIFAIFQFGWLLASCMKAMWAIRWGNATHSNQGIWILSVFYIAFFGFCLTAWISSHCILGGILIYRTLSKKKREALIKSGIPSP